MPKRSSTKREDANQAAFRVLGELTGDLPKTDPATPKPDPKPKNPAAVALGKLGGAKGGKARAAKLTPAKRAEIAKKAAKARWKKPNA